MGTYTKNLFKKHRVPAGNPTGHTGERLVSCAIYRDGEFHWQHNPGYKTHSDIRRALGDASAYTHTPGDEEGFWTSKDRFVDRRTAARIGAAAGQCRDGLGELTSDNVDRW